MPPRVRTLLSDICHSSDLIAEFIGDMTYAEYAADHKTQAACERHLMIIGEAVARLQREHVEWAEKLTHARNIKAFRNIVVHEYERVDDEVVYGVATRYAPQLRQEAILLMESNPQDADHK